MQGFQNKCFPNEHLPPNVGDGIKADIGTKKNSRGTTTWQGIHIIHVSQITRPVLLLRH
jgi:hypothetical protein